MNRSLALLAFVLALYLIVPPARGSDLEGPGGKTITVRSEIQRGEAALSRLKFGFDDDLSRCTDLVEKLVYDNIQQNTDSLGFMLGLRFAAWRKLWRLLDSGLLKGDRADAAMAQANGFYGQFLRSADALKLTPEQLRGVVGSYQGTDENSRWEKLVTDAQFKKAQEAKFRELASPKTP